MLAGCGRGNFPQSKKLDDDTIVVLKDAWVLEHMPPLLQTHFVYQGTSPNLAYNLQAALGTSRDDARFSGGWIKQVPIAGKQSTNETEVLWEFLSYPHDSGEIYMHLKFKDKESGVEKMLEFKLPGAKDLPSRKM
jgi:hypothetical protein